MKYLILKDFYIRTFILPEGGHIVLQTYVKKVPTALSFKLWCRCIDPPIHLLPKAGTLVHLIHNMLRICWNYRLFHFWASIRIIPVKFIGHRIFSRKTSTGSASSTLSSIPYRSILWLTFSPIRKSHPFPRFCLWWLSGKTWYPQQRYSPTRYRNCVHFQALFSSLPCRQCRWMILTSFETDCKSDRKIS